MVQQGGACMSPFLLYGECHSAEPVADSSSTCMDALAPLGQKELTPLHKPAVPCFCKLLLLAPQDGIQTLHCLWAIFNGVQNSAHVGAHSHQLLCKLLLFQEALLQDACHCMCKMWCHSWGWGWSTLASARVDPLKGCHL